MRSTLIVARMNPDAATDVRSIFAESDAGQLPGMIGVRERRLYQFHDLYMHWIASDQEVRRPLAEVRDHPLFRDINERLGAHISAYAPETWRGPEDAMAREFYTWSAER